MNVNVYRAGVVACLLACSGAYATTYTVKNETDYEIKVTLTEQHTEKMPHCTGQHSLILEPNSNQEFTTDCCLRRQVALYYRKTAKAKFSWKPLTVRGERTTKCNGTVVITQKGTGFFADWQ